MMRMFETQAEDFFRVTRTFRFAAEAELRHGPGKLPLAHPLRILATTVRLERPSCIAVRISRECPIQDATVN
jgi:hypothetical protein